MNLSFTEDQEIKLRQYLSDQPAPSSISHLILAFVVGFIVAWLIRRSQ